ncbi:MAG: hypothetical protein WAV56_04610, partial [Microgenomates group bacterium]
MDEGGEKRDKGLKLKKIDTDFSGDMRRPDVREYVAVNNLSLERVRYWYREPHKILEENGSDFDKFTENCRELVKKGDEIMMNVESTGFNIDRFDIFADKDFDQEDDRPTVFYNCYIERPIHFALLLAHMERLGLIGIDDTISYSCKGTKVNWKWGESDSEGEVKKVKRADGTVVAVKSTMETVLKISTND